MDSKLNKSFEILDITVDVTIDQAKQAYRDLVQIWHPDRQGHNERLRAKAEDKLKEINNAWDEVNQWFVTKEQEQKEQEYQKKVERERQQRDREAAERAETERRAQEEVKYENFSCPHCGTVNRFLRSKSVEFAKCGLCGKYLSKEREKEEQCRLRRLEDEKCRQSAEYKEKIKAMQEQAKELRFESFRQPNEHDKRIAEKKLEQDRFDEKIRTRTKGRAFGWKAIVRVIFALIILVPVVKAEYSKFLRSNEPYDVDNVYIIQVDNYTALYNNSLMWARDANISGKKMNWLDANRFVRKLNYSGYKDWRLPTPIEFDTLIDKGVIYPSENLNKTDFSNVKPGRYWTSSDFDVYNRTSENFWYLDMQDGKSGGVSRDEYLYVWPVRNNP